MTMKLDHRISEECRKRLSQVKKLTPEDRALGTEYLKSRLDSLLKAKNYDSPEFDWLCAEEDIWENA